MEHTGIKIKAVVAGIMLVAAGVILYLFNVGIFPLEYKSIVFSWPSLLVVLGFVGFFSSRKWGFSFFLMLLGGFFLIKKLDIDSLNFIVENGWALGLVVGGILIICKTIFRKKPLPGEHGNGKCCESKRDRGVRKWKEGSNKPGYIDRNFIFSGSKEKLDINAFKGGEINCIFGGMELDLSDSQQAEGTHTLEVNTVFGGIVIYAPVDWKIEIQQNSVFGNFVDNRPKPGFEVNENNTLILVANSVFGGGEIKCNIK